MWNKLSESVKSITKKSKSSFYYSFQILPAHKKAGIYSVYSFCRVTDDIVDSLEPVEKRRTELNEWENDLKTAIEKGTSENPVLDSLVKTINEFKIPTEYFFELISGAEMDLDGKIYKTFAELYQYCYKVASVVGFMSVHIFGFEDKATLKYAEKLGLAFQLTNILRDVGKDADLKRIYLPEEDLRKFAVSREEILKGEYSAKIKDLLEYQYKRADDYYKIAAELLPRADKKNMLPSEIMSKTYYKLLQKIKNKK
ncbi:MAG: squalene/phytoene synthase family protein, partial [Calditrichia bacterium]|nr:squalene/phytoene synthase family protein [Calditrichia bacterium]